MIMDERAQAFRKVIGEAIDRANGMNPREMAELMVDALRHEHRTIQQKFLGAVKLALFQYAQAEHDLRNQAAVEWAQEVAALPNADLHFPYI